MTPTADIRWQQRLSNFERALALLRTALIDGPAALNQLEKEGVVQRLSTASSWPGKPRRTTWRPMASCLRW